jgi:transcription initiation factor TFIIIB Brf1 subunit/transcription initiation factor TFIIB
MSESHPGNLHRDARHSQQPCLHQQTIIDDREGDSVCLLCGLVLEVVYQQEWRWDRGGGGGGEAYSPYENASDPTFNFLLDVAAHAEIQKCIVQQTFSYFKKIKIKLEQRTPKFPDRVLASYALYETLSRNNVSRSVQEIEFFTNCNLAKLWAVESALNLKDTLCHPLDYVERFCSQLSIKFTEMKVIKGIVGNMFGLGGIRPQCVVAVVIYLYCREIKHKLALAKICEVCDVSSTNIYAIIRKMKSMYTGKISLLYT